MASKITTAGGKVYVVINPLAIDEMLNDPRGGIVRDLLIRGERVRVEAVRIAPVGKPDPLGRPSPAGFGPGTLRSRIVKRLARAGKVPTVLVGWVKVPYGLFVHDGAKPHDIVPKKAPFLVFMGKDGTVVRTRLVHHPGNKPNRFLIRALRAAR